MKIYKLFIRSVLIIFIIMKIFIILINIYIVNYSQKYISNNILNLQKADAVMILGARVYKNKMMSSVLYDRVITAIAIYNNHKADKIIISGDSTNDKFDEVVIVKNFLIKNNINEKDIITDQKGFDTFNSMYRAGNIFKIKKLIIATQNFHLSRAIFIAKKLNIEAYGIPADKQSYIKINLFKLHERLSRVKAFIEVKL